MIIRHGFSTWNQKNLFTGWVDVDLAESGIEEARTAGQVIKDSKFIPNVVFTSALKRAVHTADLILKQMKILDVETIRSWRLNERHYGALTGLDKKETVEKFGADQVQVWRRSYDVAPPQSGSEDKFDFSKDPLYSDVPCSLIPKSECLKDVCERVMPYFDETIAPRLLNGEDVLIVAHGNSLRALIMKLEGISSTDIADFELPTGTPRLYVFNEDFSVKSAGFIEDPEVVANRALSVKAQTGKA